MLSRGGGVFKTSLKYLHIFDRCVAIYQVITTLLTRRKHHATNADGYE
ncbi:hypothetical protein J2S13_002463 [Oikeobacillus pervagus]|uniref:Uncharacterized protein n=1 Tax=Oikeobacillus pervagus TaxID=1325931 RepID=A0AAJ1T3M2_9BACI|nr:hypothetical protein [Oikeobacillus pervagus]